MLAEEEHQLSGDAVPIRLTSLKNLFCDFLWRVMGLQHCYGQETSELRSWQPWKVYYKSTLHDRLSFMAEIAFLKKRKYF